MDSYEQLLTHFNIDKASFLEWGISSIIFPPVDKVALKWKDLKNRIFYNEQVYIRGYGRDAHGTDLYIKLYEKLFDNSKVKKDPTNNSVPHRLIQQLTGLERNKHLYNYQVSHIWGHTKNIFLFEAPWNICYMPKVMDPFTGHETKGMLQKKFQELFLLKASELYKPFIDEYNDLLIMLKIKEQLSEYINSLDNSISENKRMQFAKDAERELSPIVCEKYL